MTAAGSGAAVLVGAPRRAFASGDRARAASAVSVIGLILMSGGVRHPLTTSRPIHGLERHLLSVGNALLPIARGLLAA